MALTPLDIRALAAIPPGAQPEEDGRLLCRLCGRWWRSLGHHLRGAGHRMAPAEYRETFELPATRPLMAADLREAQAERGARLVADHDGVRAAFQVDERDAPERLDRLAAGRRGKQATASRAGVQRSKLQVGQILADSSRRRAEQRRQTLEEQARKLKYQDLRQMVAATSTLTHAEFGDLLGLKADAARWWRRELGGSSEARTGRAAAQREAWRSGLEQVPRGEQPEQGGALRCLVCGLFKRDLAQHVTGTHKITAQDYRARFGLASDLVLRGADLRRQDHQLAQRSGAAGTISGRARSEETFRQYDDLARRAGYAGVVALLVAAEVPEVMRVLQVTRPQAGRLRRRYT